MSGVKKQRNHPGCDLESCYGQLLRRTAVDARLLIELSNLGAQRGRHSWTHTASVNLPGLAQVLQREARPGLEDVQRVDLFQVAIQFIGLASA